MPSDSPTVSKECLRVVLALTASSGWSLASFDIKAAFLQGKKLDRVVFLRPPTEARIEGFIWKLKKTVYGLEDASRYWYFEFRNTAISLGCQKTVLGCQKTKFQISNEENQFFTYLGMELSSKF